MRIELEVAPGVHRVEHAYTNFFLVEDAGRVTVVDACVPTAWSGLTDALARIGRTLDDVEALVLTHAHFDHVGFAERARRELGVPVHLHENDVPLSRHPARYDHERFPPLFFLTHPRALPILGALTRNRAFLASPLHGVTRFGDDAGALPVPGRPVVVPCPGHTVGHCAFHLPERDVLLCGDALVTLDPYTARTGPCLVARAATADVERNLRSLDALAATGARTLLVGHGEPWTGGVEAGVEQARRAGAA